MLAWGAVTPHHPGRACSLPSPHPPGCPAQDWRGVRSRTSVLLVDSLGSGMLSTAMLVLEAEKREPGAPSPLLGDLAPFPANLKPAHLRRASWSVRTRVANGAPEGRQEAVLERVYSLPERRQTSRVPSFRGHVAMLWPIPQVEVF